MHEVSPRRGSSGAAAFLSIRVKILLGSVLAVAILFGFRNLWVPRLRYLATAVGFKKSATSLDTKLQALVDTVKRYAVVPDTEVPKVATIQDITLVRPQNPLLYRDAQNGDRVLLWRDTAVIYSSARDRVLVVLPISPSTSPATTTSPAAKTSSTQKEQATIEVRNGSRISGAAAAMVSQLSAAGLSVFPATDAQSTSYLKTVIVERSNKAFPQTLQTIRTITKAQVVAQPAKEKDLKGDFLIILGADQAR